MRQVRVLQIEYGVQQAAVRVGIKPGQMKIADLAVTAGTLETSLNTEQLIQRVQFLQTGR
jgi:hypothetical protein